MHSMTSFQQQQPLRKLHFPLTTTTTLPPSGSSASPSHHRPSPPQHSTENQFTSFTAQHLHHHRTLILQPHFTAHFQALCDIVTIPPPNFPTPALPESPLPLQVSHTHTPVHSPPTAPSSSNSNTLPTFGCNSQATLSPLAPLSPTPPSTCLPAPPLEACQPAALEAAAAWVRAFTPNNQTV